MKVKDLKPDVNIQEVLVKIPQNIKIPDYGTAPRREVYIRGWMWDSLMVSLHPNDKRVYPILSLNPDILNWEVIDPKYMRK